MWWIGLVWVLSLCLLLYLHLMKHPLKEVVDSVLPTAVFIPIVGIFTVANTAGVIVNTSVNHTHLPDRLAVPLIFVGYICVGMGVGVALIMHAVYAYRLFTSGWPTPLKIPSMILTVRSSPSTTSPLLINDIDRTVWAISQRADPTRQCCCFSQILCRPLQGLLPVGELGRDPSRRLCTRNAITGGIFHLLDLHRLLRHRRGSVRNPPNPSQPVLVVDYLPRRNSRHRTGRSGRSDGFPSVSHYRSGVVRVSGGDLCGECEFYGADGIKWAVVWIAEEGHLGCKIWRARAWARLGEISSGDLHVVICRKRQEQ